MNKNIRMIAVESNLIVEEYNGFDRAELTQAEIEFAKGIITQCIFIVQCGVVRNGHDSPEYKRSVRHITDLEYFRDNI